MSKPNDSYTPPSVGGLADNPTQYAYDGDRLLTRVTRPDGNLLLARYDSDTGLLDSLTQARGKNTFSYFGTGQLASVTSPDGISLSYGYDGPVLRSESWGGLRGAGSVDSVSALVNIAFKPWVETVNNASPVNYGYDRDGLLDTLAVNTTTELFTYRGGDGLLSNTSVGGVTSEVSYDNHGEPWKLHYAWTGDSFEQVLTRDSLGRIVHIAESGFGSRSYGYHYDAAGRLDSVAVDSVKRAGYTYDANGNRMAWRGPTSADTASATCDAQDRMLRYGDRVYAYTAAGELVRRTSGPTDTLRTTYDVLGNLTGARAPSGDSLRYLVDGANRRVTRMRNGHERTSWLYAGGIFIAAELDSTGAVRNRYAYGSRGHVPDLVVQGGVTYRLITDQLGSVRAAVNVNTGVVAQRIDYDAWGVITYDSAATFQSLGYAGGLEDRTTGLVRFGARDYEAGVGRWTCKDPMKFGSGILNLYAYCENEPINIVDPNGLWKHYGNWGGPNWTNGTDTWSELDDFPMPGEKGFVAPIDARDAAYFRHDVALHNCAFLTDPLQRQECRRDADQDLADALFGLWVSPCSRWRGDPEVWLEYELFNGPGSPNDNRRGKRPKRSAR